MRVKEKIEQDGIDWDVNEDEMALRRNINRDKAVEGSQLSLLCP
jgi:hypothetical protein